MSLRNLLATKQIRPSELSGACLLYSTGHLLPVINAVSGELHSQITGNILTTGFYVPIGIGVDIVSYEYPITVRTPIVSVSLGTSGESDPLLGVLIVGRSLTGVVVEFSSETLSDDYYLNIIPAFI